MSEDIVRGIVHHRPEFHSGPTEYRPRVWNTRRVTDASPIIAPATPAASFRTPGVTLYEV
jgi:hypothetical protein